MGSASSMKSLPQSWSVMLRLGPPKNEEKSVKTVLETGLSCCAEWILTYVSEMGDQKLTHNLWSWLHTLSLLSVLICDAKTWSTKKQGEGCEYNFTVLLCWTDLDLRMRDGWLTADPSTMWSQLDPESLLAVLICDARTWSYKKQEEECESNFGNWTVLLCWMDPDLCIRDGWGTADPQCGVSFTHEVSLQSWSVMLRHGPLKKQGEGCENYFGNWTVLLCWMDLELCTRDG